MIKNKNNNSFNYFKNENLKTLNLKTSTTVLKLGDFFQCPNLKKVILPENLEELPPYLFAGCENLEEVILPKNLKKLPEGIFSNCKRLKKINLPSTLEEINKEAFAGCENIQTITLPEKLTTIQDKAFFGCKKLSKITLPTHIKVIPEGCFKNCSSLISLNMDNIEEVHSYAFTNCSRLKDFPKNAKTLKKAAFKNCRSLDNIHLNPNINSLADELFYGCTNLKTITGENISLQKAVFKNCLSLNKIPNFVKELGPYSFENTAIEEFINIYERIPLGAFRNCKKLRNIYNSTYSKTIEASSFLGCTSLEEFSFSDLITEIKSDTFKNCFSLKKVSFPSKLSKIGNNAFENCYNLESPIFPHQLEQICKNAFFNCHSIKKLYLPERVKFLGNEVFSNLYSLTKIQVSPYNPLFAAYKDEILLNIITQNIILYAMGLPNKSYSFEDFCLPKTNEIETIIPIYGIKPYAFAGAKNLEELILPSSIKDYDCKAFEKCNNLKKLTIFMLPLFSAFSPELTDNGRFFLQENNKNLTYPFLELEIKGKILYIQCNNFNTLFKKLEKLTISSDSTLQISSPLFPFSPNIKKVNLPKNIVNLPERSFPDDTILSFTDRFQLPQKFLKSLTTINQEKIYEFQDGSFFLEKNNHFREITKDKIKTYYQSPDSILDDPQKVLDYQETLKKWHQEKNLLLRNGNLTHYFGQKYLQKLLEIYDEDIERMLIKSKILEEPLTITTKKILEEPNNLLNYFFLIKKYGLKDTSELNPILIVSASKIDIEKILKNYNPHIKRLFKESKIDKEKETAADNITDLYKIANVLGAFEEDPKISQQACIFIIDNMFKTKTNDHYNENQIIGDDIHRKFETIKETTYNPEFSKFLMKNYNKLMKIEKERSGFIAEVCNNFKEISKTSTSNKGLQRHLQVTIDKCEHYLSLQKFKNVTPQTLPIATLLGKWFTDQESFDIAVEVINEGKKAPRNIFSKYKIIEDNIIFDDRKENDLKEQINPNFSYEWLPKSSLANLVLGKYCDCCAHVKGAGAGIMRASIIDPNCQNLVIRNNIGEIIAKATIYVNRDKNYAVFNNLESNRNFKNNESLEKICAAFLRGTQDFYNKYNENNPTSKLTTITIGEGMNTIINNLNEQNFETLTDDILPPLDFSNYIIHNRGSCRGNAFVKQKRIIPKKR